MVMMEAGRGRLWLLWLRHTEVTVETAQVGSVGGLAIVVAHMGRKMRK